MMCVEGARYISLWVPNYALQRYNVTQTLDTKGFPCSVFENRRATSNFKKKLLLIKKKKSYRLHSEQFFIV